MVEKPGSYWAAFSTNQQPDQSRNLELARAKSDFLNKYKTEKLPNYLPKIKSKDFSEKSFDSDYLLPPRRMLIFPHYYMDLIF